MQTEEECPEGKWVGGKWSDWHKGKTHSAADHRLSAAGKAVFQFTMLTLWQKKALRPQAAPRGMPPQAAAFHTLYIYMEHPHPLSDFKFCPHCGGAQFHEHDAHSKRCATCGFTFYPNAAAATVAVIVTSHGQLLCTVRQRQPAAGTLDLPGGFVDPGESLEEGLRREVREELGAELAQCTYLFSLPNDYPFSGHTVHTADAFFLCTLAPGSQPQAADDAASIVYLPPSQLQPSRFGLHSISRGVARLLQAWPTLPQP